MRSLLLALLLVGLAWVAGPAFAQEAAEPAPSDDAVLEQGRQATEALRGDSLDGLWERMTPQMRQALGGTLEAFRGVPGQVTAQLGDETAVVEESVTRQAGYLVYQRISRYSGVDAEVITAWTFDSEWAIAGFTIRPRPGERKAVDSPHLDYQLRSRLRLPFEGSWFVFWGGRTIEQNYHAIDRGQRFALDFLVMEDGATHTGDGSRLDQYHCWGLPILAPASGTVVTALDGLPDQEIGSMDPANAVGNHVILDLGHDEYAVFAHFQKGSVAVAEGDRVAPGETLGLCGNSGNTSEPHLHFHLQDSPVFGQGDGLPITFVEYEVDGEPVASGEPVRGETVSPASAGDS
jgi:hypothetical protein